MTVVVAMVAMPLFGAIRPGCPQGDHVIKRKAAPFSGSCLPAGSALALPETSASGITTPSTSTGTTTSP